MFALMYFGRVETGAEIAIQVHVSFTRYPTRPQVLFVRVNLGSYKFLTIVLPRSYDLPV